MISDTEVRVKINKIFKNHNPLEKYSVKIYKIDPYFYEQHEKYIKVDDNNHKYISFKIDIYFSEYSLAVQYRLKKIIKIRILFLKEKEKKH